MARQVQPAEVTSFVKGLITEASPLTFPDQASLDEVNFVLDTDGSRRRRLGMDFEEGYEEVSVSSSSASPETIFSTFSWDNAGGDSEKSIIVVQGGNQILFFDADTQPFSSSLIRSFSVSASVASNRFSYAVVDGDLIVATGEQVVRRYSYTGSSVSASSYRLKMRDQFGVADPSHEGSNISYRSDDLGYAHRYNLRNQTWALPMKVRSDNYKRSSEDPILSFKSVAGKSPSYADAVTYNLGAWLEDSETEESFLVDECIDNPPGNYRAPMGYFIIDVLNRGASRLDEVQNLYSNYDLSYPIPSLPTDSTPGGATCVEEYAGRIWYAGFSGEVDGGDDRSPRLSSYVFYSQLVTDPSKLPLCYQEGDPTSAETPDLIDTDGGFIRIDSAYGIKRLISVGSGILVIAENGIWMISGGSDYGFSATNNMRRKVSERGAIGAGAVVRLDDGIAFWAEDAIYQVGPNQFGDYEAQNLTQTTIQSYYDGISSVDKKYAQGVWDSYDQKIRWVYNNRSDSTGTAKELVLDVPLGAFYPSEVGVVSGTTLPRIVAPVEVPPFQIVTVDEDVTHNSVSVTYNGGQVTQQSLVQADSGFREVAYLTISSVTPFQITFSSYRDTGFRDWRSVNGEGVDASAFLLTGYMSGGDFLRKKDVPYIQFYLRKTETGFYEDETGNIFPEGESSCLVRSQWNWTNSPAGNKWGRQFQAYRHRRLYSPATSSDSYDNGQTVVKTRSKLRGGGNVVSLLIETEENKDLQLLGWSMVMGIGNGY